MIPSNQKAVPLPPTSLSAVPGDGKAIISFTQDNNGIHPILNYEYSLDNGASFIPFSPVQKNSPVTITGLTNGTQYVIKLIAVNRVGASEASIAVVVIPSTPFSTINNITFLPGNNIATIYIDISLGSIPITNYQYKINGGAFQACNPPISQSPLTLFGLTNDTEYSIEIQALNDTTSVSNVSNAVLVTPSTPYQYGSPWPHSGGLQNQNTRFSIYTGPRTITTSSIISGLNVPSNLVLSNNNIIYYTSFNGPNYYIGACDTKTLPPSKLWEYTTSARNNTIPCIDSSGNIHVGSDNSKMYSLSPQGDLNRTFTTGAAIKSSACISPDGTTLYFGSNDSYLYAINKTDYSQKWRYQCENALESSPAIDSSGNIIIGDNNGILYSISSAGIMQWELNLSPSSPITKTITIFNNIIYVGSPNGNVYAVYTTGSVKWTYNINSAVTTSCSVDLNGNIYLGSSQKYYVISSNGNNIIKTFSFVSPLSAIISSNNILYIVDNDSFNAYDINNNYNVLWTSNQTNSAYSSPILGKDNDLYFSFAKNTGTGIYNIT